MIADTERAREYAHNICKYHQPDSAGVEAISAVRVAAEELIFTILCHCPASPDASAAIRKAREAMMTANSSIVLQDPAAAVMGGSNV
jgi:hypothetical protein